MDIASLNGKPLINNDDYEIFEESETFEIGFKEHYHEHLLPLVRSYEIDRVAALKKSQSNRRKAIPFMVLMPIFSLFLMYITEFNSNFFELLIWANIGVYSALFAYIRHSLKKYTSSIKSQIFPKILSFLGNFEYLSENEEIKLNEYEKYNIIPHHSRSSCEDYIRGDYKSVNIELFEARLERRKKRGYYTVFSGLIIKLSVNKNFNGKTLIKTDKGSVGNWLSQAFNEFPRVHLEDPEFEKIFEVFSEDQVEARYLLTTSFMERLLEVRKIFKSDKMQCSFLDQSLLMLLPIDKDMFEPGPITEPEDFIDDSKNLLREMHSIFNICDTLKLDMNTGL
jgi:hypothetical protein